MADDMGLFIDKRIQNGGKSVEKIVPFQHSSLWALLFSIPLPFSPLLGQ